MSAEIADYIQIFLLGMILCWFLILEAGKPDAGGLDQNIPVMFLSLLVFLVTVTAIAFGVAYGVWWAGAKIVHIVTTTDWNEFLRNR